MCTLTANQFPRGSPCDIKLAYYVYFDQHTIMVCFIYLFSQPFLQECLIRSSTHFSSRSENVPSGAPSKLHLLFR